MTAIAQQGDSHIQRNATVVNLLNKASGIPTMYIPGFIRIFWFLSLVFCLHGQAATTDNRDGMMEVNYWGGKSGRMAYELDVLRAALDATADHYPVYKLTIDPSPLGALRGREMVAKGESLNLYVSGLRHDALTAKGRILMVPTPTMKGLLGYRSLIIRKGDYEKFRHIKSLAQLRKLIIGQGSNWEDAATLRHNKLRIDDSGRYENLLNMLNHHRFDAVLLGAVEAPAVLAESPLRDRLMILPEAIVYYPHAMIFQVSGKAPQLAERLRTGMRILEENGTISALMEHHFGDTLSQLRGHQPHVIVLEHPTPEHLPDLVTPKLLNALPWIEDSPR